MTRVLSVENLSIGMRRKAGPPLQILRDVCFDLHSGETLGIVGESGCGKSTLLNALLGYLKPGLDTLSGQVLLGGTSMLDLGDAAVRALRGRHIGLVPQNASQTLTPTMRIRSQMAEQLAIKAGMASDRLEARMIELLEAVRLPEPTAILERYPHELSGGQQQRVAIALALAGDPEILLLDEPTTALDVTTKVHILDILRDIVRERKLTMIYVSHDIGVISRVSQKIVVMYAGEVVEAGTVDAVLKSPRHPYTQGLLASIPKLAERRLPVPMPGALPPLSALRTACAFAPRCGKADARCTGTIPPRQMLADGRSVFCFHPADPPPQGACRRGFGGDGSGER